MSSFRACWVFSAFLFGGMCNSAAAQSSLGTFVALGDSLSAGFQNFSLYTSSTGPEGTPPGGQEYGYAALIARQAGADLQLPTISYPGIPPVLTGDLSDPSTIMRGQIVGQRVNVDQQTLNLSVPGYAVADTLARVINLSTLETNPIDALAVNVLAFPGAINSTPPCGALPPSREYPFPPYLTISSALCAVELRPSTILLSIGSNNALQALTFGVPPTNAAKFAADYAILLAGLSTTRAHIVLSNIADVTAIPLVRTVNQFERECGFTPQDARPSDYVVPNLADPTKFSGYVCFNYVVRTASLVQQARTAVTEYNAAIALEAAAAHAIVVDLHGLFARLARTGYQVNGRTLTTGFGGGLFSLDGEHPTNTGYAIAANEFINTINQKLHTAIPLVSVEEVAASDPLLPPVR